MWKSSLQLYASFAWKQMSPWITCGAVGRVGGRVGRVLIPRRRWMPKCFYDRSPRPLVLGTSRSVSGEQMTHTGRTPWNIPHREVAGPRRDGGEGRGETLEKLRRRELS